MDREYDREKQHPPSRSFTRDHRLICVNCLDERFSKPFGGHSVGNSNRRIRKPQGPYVADRVKAGHATSSIDHATQILGQALRPFLAEHGRAIPKVKRLSEADSVRESFCSDAQAETLIAALPEALLPEDGARRMRRTGIPDVSDQPF